jgi:hypothetical protein
MLRCTCGGSTPPQNCHYSLQPLPMIEFYALRRYNVGLDGLPISYMRDSLRWVQVLRNPLELLVVRSYHQENRRSHQNSQLKPVWAGLVLG